jgi:hypothetical protein
MKRCSNCKIEKSFDDFSKLKSSKDGYRYSCKECVKEYNKNYKKEYYLTHKETIDLKNKEYYLDNKERVNKYASEYWKIEENKKRRVGNNRKWQIDNHEKIRVYKRDYYKNVIMKDDLKKLRCSIRSSVKRFLKNKSDNTEIIIGCTYEYVKMYLESKFEDWMSWDNYGKYNGELNYGWDIDHIIPLSSGKTEDEIIKLNYYTNLQPLCSKINRDIKKDNETYKNI